MTDFIGDLERELLGAAHRRAERTWWRPAIQPRRLLGPVLALAAVAAVVAVALALTRGGESDVAAPASGIQPAQTPAACGATARPHLERAPSDVINTLGVLRRARRPSDALPRLPAAAPTWLPVGDWGRSNARRANPGTWVIPTADLRSGAPACGDTRGLGPGACLLTVKPMRFACFTLAEIRKGTAFALFGGVALGLAADGPTRVLVRAGGDTFETEAVNNVVAGPAVGIEPGAGVAIARRTATVAVLDAGGSHAAATAAAAQIARSQHLRPSIGKAHEHADGVVVWLDDVQQEALATEVCDELGGTTAFGRPPGADVHADVVVMIGRTR